MSEEINLPPDFGKDEVNKRIVNIFNADIKEFIEKFERLSRVIDWEDDIGEWREIKEADWQKLKENFA